MKNNRDIFTVDFEKYVIAHCCITCDCKMDSSNKKHLKLYHLQHKYIDSYPSCVFHNNVLNLITKSKCWGKPSYETLDMSLKEMKDIIIKEGITKIVMPRIGCELDWDNVKKIIISIFKDIDIEILICWL